MFFKNFNFKIVKFTTLYNLMEPQLIQPNHKTLPLNYQPQQNEFKFNNIRFSSKFDSGNLLNVVQVDDNTVR
jgi:hypothetical protein